MNFDVVILGAGGAGLMCALQAGRRGLKVAVIDHSLTVGGKIIISGGGRCNFTNTGITSKNYVSQNEHFAKSALSRFTADHFIEMVKAHGIAFHEKKLGQLFCDKSAKQIVEMLKKECADAKAEIFTDCRIKKVSKDSNFKVETSQGIFESPKLVVATGGLSIPKIGATGLGYEIAKQFGLKVLLTKPALDGFVFSREDARIFSELAGLSVDCKIHCNGAVFRENILFTHLGLSGPASLQASLYWNKTDAVKIDLFPDLKILDWLMAKKSEASKALIKNLLSELLPSRLAETLCEINKIPALPVNQTPDKVLEAFAKNLHEWVIFPQDTVGYQKAEVTKGGVDTDELSSKTLESKKVPGLFFIGEVVDVTGWLGGYNFQWAWSSAWAAAQAL